jgi:single-strand DNA-binding protein
MVNVVIVQGTLGHDPEMKSSPSGVEYTRFSIAQTETYKGKKTVYWFNIVAWQKTAELCVKYLKKGTQALFQCKLTSNKFKKDGVERVSYELVLDRLTFLPQTQAKAEEDFTPPF